MTSIHEDRSERSPQPVEADALPSPPAHQGYCPGRLSEENRQLLATLGHELRNPLGTLQSVLGLLAEEPMDREVRKRLYAVLQRQVRHLDRLVQDLIESAHSPSHTLAMEREPLDLGELVVEVMEALHPAIIGDRRTLELVREGGPAWVQGDPVRLSQVVRNLLSNAHRFTEAGGTIRVALEDGGDGFVSLRVTDDGVGLDPEVVETIFEPFQRRVGTSKETSDGGLGLGLTIVRRLVEAHGGRVRARSDGHGHGTEVEVLLPRFDPDRAT